MPNYDDTVAAASAGVGTDLFSGKSYAKKPTRRHLTGFGVVGGNAINESKVNLIVGGVDEGTYLNTNSGVSGIPDEMLRKLDIGVLENELIECKVVTAPTVSPIVWRLEIEDL